MRIVHVEDYFDPTAGYQINELLIASKELKDEVYLITSKDMSPFHKVVDMEKDKKFEENTGVKILRLESSYKLSSRLILKNLKSTIDKINPDIVFMHGIGDFKDLQLFGKKPTYKIVRDCHMSWVASKNKFRQIFYFIFRLFFATIINKTDRYEKIYALGDEEYEYLKKIGIHDKKIDFLRHGYNESVMYYDAGERKRIREDYHFNDIDIIISYIGKFNYSKRPDLVLEIVDILPQKFIDSNNLKLLFVGPKDEKYMLVFNEKLKKMKNKVEIVVDDSKPFVELRKYYSASDICIFPRETTLSSIHAQVCGCPVVMENHKSNKERVVNNNNLYHIGDLEEACNILQRSIEDREYVKNNRRGSVLKDREYKNQVKIFKSIKNY